jgi:glycosyltransferase involved in cell wall biosynthesis
MDNKSINASYLKNLELSIAANKPSIDSFNLAEKNLYAGFYNKAEELIAEYRSGINYGSFPKYDGRHLDSPELSIIIVAYKTNDLLIDCIQSLSANNSGAYEVIVVDNGGNEKVLDKLLEFPLLYICSPHNFKPSEARNIGAYFSKGNIIAFIDDDTIVGKDFVKDIIETFREYNIIGLRGKILFKTGHYNNKMPGHYNLGDNCKFIRFAVTECNCAFSRKEYLALNGMNPLLFGHEGIELSYRIEKKYGSHKILYSPEMIIYHDFADSDLKLQTKLKRHEMMWSYLKFRYPDIEKFVADIDYIDNWKHWKIMRPLRYIVRLLRGQ